MSTNNNLTIGEVITKTTQFLNERGIPNPRLEADLLLAGILELPRVSLYSQWDRPLEPQEIQSYREIIVKRAQGWPVAYLTGKKAFLSWDFTVSPAVLIPRPETELLVETVVETTKFIRPLHGVDIGTGSGIIAIALAKLIPESTWEAVDISPEALKIAEKNAVNLGVADRIHFRQSDLLAEYAHQNEVFDVIVANPPYIREEDIGTLQPEVQKEPWLALNGGPDGLEVYRRLLPQATRLLKPGGWIALEHGDEQGDDLMTLAAEQGLSCRDLQDLAGRDRVLIGQKQNNA